MHRQRIGLGEAAQSVDVACPDGGFDGGAIAFGQRWPRREQRAGGHRVVHPVARVLRLGADIDADDGDAETGPVEPERAGVAIAPVGGRALVPAHEAVPQRPRRRAAAHPGDLAEGGVGQVQPERAGQCPGQRGKARGRRGQPGGGGDGVGGMDMQRERLVAPPKVAEFQHLGGKRRGGVEPLVIEPDPVAPVVGRGDPGGRAPIAQRNRQRRVERQVQRPVALAPVFRQSDVGGRMGAGRHRGGQACGQKPVEGGAGGVSHARSILFGPAGPG